MLRQTWPSDADPKDLPTFGRSWHGWTGSLSYIGPIGRRFSDRSHLPFRLCPSAISSLLAILSLFLPRRQLSSFLASLLCPAFKYFTIHTPYITILSHLLTLSVKCDLGVKASRMCIFSNADGAWSGTRLGDSSPSLHVRADAVSLLQGECGVD